MSRLIDADALYKMLSLEADDYMGLGRFERARGLESALWAIKDAPTVGGWTLAKDKLPPMNKDVLVYAVRKVSGESQMLITSMRDEIYLWGGRSSKIKPEWVSPYQYFHANNVITHWMVLPDPPKEEK